MELMAIPAWLFVFGVPIATISWIVARFRQRPRVPVGQGLITLGLWLGSLLAIGAAFLQGVGSMHRSGINGADVLFGTLVIVLPLITIWSVWRLYYRQAKGTKGLLNFLAEQDGQYEAALKRIDGKKEP
jgi:hypothetical protein